MITIVRVIPVFKRCKSIFALIWLSWCFLLQYNKVDEVSCEIQPAWHIQQWYNVWCQQCPREHRQGAIPENECECHIPLEDTHIRSWLVLSTMSLSGLRPASAPCHNTVYNTDCTVQYCFCAMWKSLPMLSIDPSLVNLLWRWSKFKSKVFIRVLKMSI